MGRKPAIPTLSYITDYAEVPNEDEAKVVEVEPVETAEEQEQEGDVELVIPEDLSEVPDADLAGLHSSAVEAFNALYGTDGKGLTDDDLNALSVLTTGIERVQSELEERNAKMEARAAEATALAAKVGIEANAGETQVVEEPAEEQTFEAEPEPVKKNNDIRINLSGLRSRASAPAKTEAFAPKDPNAPLKMEDIFKAADLPGYANGEGVNFTDLGKGLDRRLASFNKAQWELANATGRHMTSQQSLAVIHKPLDPDLIITSSDLQSIDSIIQHARNEKRLEGNSLVAAGGWCAPSETIYDIVEQETRDGLFSLPEIGITRGGIKFTTGPDFAAIFAGTGFSYTEAEDVAGDYDGAGGGTKPCYTVDCPDFTEVRLNYDGVCINAGLLMQRGYPEVIARTIRGALVAHDHRMSTNLINAVITGSTAVSMPADQVGAIAPLLTAIELQVEHYRSVHRLGRGTTLEAVFPFWVRGAVRADLARRLGVDLISVPDSRVDGWFRDAGVSPQYVYGINDFGGAPGTAVSYPTTVRFLLYSAGTWVKGTSDIITLDTLYDSVKLGTNDYTALFTEEGWLVAKTGLDSRIVTVPICPDGATHGGVDIDCDGSAAAVTP